MENLINTAEAAKRLKITQRRVVGLIEEGHLPATKIGRFYLIKVEDLSKAETRPEVGRPKRQQRRQEK